MDNGGYLEIRGAPTRKQPSGTVKELVEVPQVRQAERLADQLLKLEREFGLTPAARANLAVPRKNEDEKRGKDSLFASPG